jgi:hypothetical protein
VTAIVLNKRSKEKPANDTPDAPQPATGSHVTQSQAHPHIVIVPDQGE